MVAGDALAQSVTRQKGEHLRLELLTAIAGLTLKLEWRQMCLLHPNGTLSRAILCQGFCRQSKVHLYCNDMPNTICRDMKICSIRRKRDYVGIAGLISNEWLSLGWWGSRFMDPTFLQVKETADVLLMIYKHC